MRHKRLAAILCCLGVTLLPMSKSIAAEYTTDGTADCTVAATVSNSYVVSIPATLSLAKTSEGEHAGKYIGEYTVGAKGNIGAGYAVFITPNPNFTLSATGKASVTASVSQLKTRWSASELSGTFNETTGIVVAALTEAGTWSGSLHFSFGITSEP